ncbi:hypothetical protein GCM10010502_29820 [Kitasatospora aureofaciens]|uniref:Uncharacterized protein n=1 Tax=Kitasatospora aureofaciens TaxID=1894 RepID=A0A8H9HQ28_KITAU|nr:hypothetical protein GCM10010502_29820 [Kitasatospora aureofaciens]
MVVNGETPSEAAAADWERLPGGRGRLRTRRTVLTRPPCPPSPTGTGGRGPPREAPSSRPCPAPAGRQGAATPAAITAPHGAAPRLPGGGAEAEERWGRSCSEDRPSRASGLRVRAGEPPFPYARTHDQH